MPKRVRDFWRENRRMSYRTASGHGGLVSFVAPMITTILTVAGVSAVTENLLLVILGGVPLGSIVWFGILMLFVTPARMWVADQTRLEPTMRFVDNPDNYQFYPQHRSEVHRVTIVNIGVSALTGVRVIFDNIDPLPLDLKGMMGFEVGPTGASLDAKDYRVTLQPDSPEIYDLFSSHRENEKVMTWHKRHRWWAKTYFPATITLRVSANESKPCVLLFRVERADDAIQDGQEFRVVPVGGYTLPPKVSRTSDS